MFYLGNVQIFDQMKNALSLSCLLLAGILLSKSGFSQNSAPYNPDGNGDGMIGVTDLQDFLSTYGLAFEATASTWSCGDPIGYAGVDYSTVQIGDQCWFAENPSHNNLPQWRCHPAGLDKHDLRVDGILQ